MSIWIKVCGLTTATAVTAALTAKVDAVGFVFAPSKRQVTPEQAAALAASVPAHVLRVAVMQHPTQAWVNQVCTVFKPDVLQTDYEDLQHLQLPHDIKVLPVLRAGQVLPATVPARCLFEGPHSGTGMVADWTAAATLAQRTQMILAGGLDADNVGTAIAAVQPFGVDVSTGVESAPGIKDPNKIAAFVQAVRQ